MASGRGMSRRGMSQRLRALVGDGGIHVLPGVYNAITAKIAESAGFEAVGVSGYGVSASLIGQPDIGLTTCSEIVMVSGYVVDAVNVPVIADADTGFGNAINTMRTTEQFIKAGVAGIHIEDQVAPKRCGHVAGKEIIPLEEAVGKYRAAVKVRNELDPDFILIARTDARGVAGGSVDEVIRRANAYVEAGVDVIFPEGLLDAAEIGRVCRAVKAPVLYNRTGISANLSLDELKELARAPAQGGAQEPSGRRFPCLRRLPGDPQAGGEVPAARGDAAEIRGFARLQALRRKKRCTIPAAPPAFAR